MLTSGLAAFGAAVHRGPYVLAGNARHTASLFIVSVGATAKAGKGTAMNVVRRMLERLDPDMAERIIGGFGSGEALVDEIRDRRDEDDDEAPRDTRALVHEAEFGGLLSVMSREGSRLGTVVREAWDGSRLQARSRKATSVASSYHLAAICHVTDAELRASLSAKEIHGGTGNRFLYIRTHRARLLPSGGNVPDWVLDSAASNLAGPLAAARRRGEMRRTPEADELWAATYYELADDDPEGVVGALIARAAPQVLRLSLVYALADGADAIDVPHVSAARAVWDFSRSTVEAVFGDALGDPIADKVLQAARSAGPAGIDRTSIRDLFGRHEKADRIDEGIERLVALGRVRVESVRTDGRSRTVVVAVEHIAEPAR